MHLTKRFLWILGLTVGLLVLRAPAADTAAATTAPAEVARLDRGARLRDALLDTLELAYAHRSTWPDRPAGGDPGWSYVRPTPRPVADDWRMVSAATVVLTEPLADHPDGAWVGYADGHVEFAKDSAAMAECSARLSLAEQAVAATRGERAAASQPVKPPIAGDVHFRVTDSAGRPVAGAEVGTWGHFGDGVDNQALGFRFSTGAVTTGSDGRATVPATAVFAYKFGDRPTAPVWVWSDRATLMAWIDVRRSDLAGPEVQVVAEPPCRVDCRVTSLGLRAAGKAIKSTLVSVAQPGLMRWYTVTVEVQGDRFNLPLPAGDWELGIYANETLTVDRHVHIEPGQRTLDLQVDLPPDEAVTRFGKPAPELRQIKGWKNGGPTTLADLRGRVVVLDFWGFWCGPCVGSMPALMKLHDDFHDKGLTILAVHDDSAESMAEVDRKCAEARRRLWGDRDLPFLVALDGGGMTRIAHTAHLEAGATTAAYGITRYPTTLLVNRAGVLVGEGDPRDPDLRATVERLLAEPRAATGPNRSK